MGGDVDSATEPIPVRARWGIGTSAPLVLYTGTFEPYQGLDLLFAAAAIVCTLTYDALTNVYTGVFWARMVGGTEYGRWVMIALFNPGALLFSAMHVGSNIFFFALFGPVFVKGVERGKAALK